MEDLLVPHTQTRLMADPCIAVSDIEKAIDSYLKSTGNSSFFDSLSTLKACLKLDVKLYNLSLGPH